MSPNLSMEPLNEILRRQQAQEHAQREAIREAVASASAPLSPELVTALIRLFDRDVHEIMRGHPGYELSERRASYQAALAILEGSIEDLLLAVDDFSARALVENPSIFSLREAQTLQAIENRIQKELFATANAAASLVDHSRRVQKLLELSDHAARLQSHFGDDGLHEFVNALRVLLHHLHIVEAGYNLRRSYAEETSSATFVISKATLLRVIPQHDLSKRERVLQYVNAQPESIDLKPLFGEYLRRVREFYAWFDNELASDSLVALRDYDRIMQEKQNHNDRMWWKAMLGNWLWNSKTPPNPHNHLRKYLTEEQLAQVYSLPRNSKEQVDLVIRFVDEHNAIDDELRTLAYELFERSSRDTSYVGTVP